MSAHCCGNFIEHEKVLCATWQRTKNMDPTDPWGCLLICLLLPASTCYHSYFLSNGKLMQKIFDSSSALSISDTSTINYIVLRLIIYLKRDTNKKSLQFSMLK